MKSIRLTLEEFCELVRQEPELPGPIPEELKQFARKDLETYSREIVKATKESIIDRVWQDKRMIIR